MIDWLIFIKYTQQIVLYIHENTDIDNVSVQSNIYNKNLKTHLSNKIVDGPVDKGTPETSYNDNMGVHMGGFFAS